MSEPDESSRPSSFLYRVLVFHRWLSTFSLQASWHLVSEADVLHYRTAAGGSLMQWGDALVLLFVVDHTIVASSHEHVPLLRCADRGGGFGDVWEMRQSRDVVQQAARLRVGGIAVGVAVFLLDVPP